MLHHGFLCFNIRVVVGIVDDRRITEYTSDTTHVNLGVGVAEFNDTFILAISEIRCIVICITDDATDRNIRTLGILEKISGIVIVNRGSTGERIGAAGSADKTSFAVSGDEAFVIKTDDIYAYVQSFRLGGNELHKYKFNSNLSRLFQDGSNVFALLYTGELYQIGNGGSQYVARLETDSTPFNAGDGYIFTDKHELVSLYDGSTEYIMSAKPKLTTASEYGLITHSGSSVKCGSREVLQCSSPAYVLSCKNLCAAVYSDFSYDITKLNTENDNAKPDKSPAESNRSLRNNSVGQSEDDEISLSIPYPVRNRTICDVEASLSVSEFFSCFDEKPELYNADGARIYNGNIKTGYTIRYNDALYEIAVKGDLNCDGKLKDNDVSALMLHLAGKKPLTGASLIAADYNLDSRVSNADLVLMAKAAEK